MLPVIPLWDRYVPRTVLKCWQSWLSHDNHMTIKWQSGIFVTNASSHPIVGQCWQLWLAWQSHDSHMTVTWQSHTCHMTVESVVILQVWPGNTTFPDFTHPAIGTYWSQQLASFRENISFDGLWIDMNEPSNFIPGSTEGCPDSVYNSPPFLPGRCCMNTCKYVHTYVCIYVLVLF